MSCVEATCSVISLARLPADLIASPSQNTQLAQTHSVKDDTVPVTTAGTAADCRALQRLPGFPAVLSPPPAHHDGDSTSNLSCDGYCCHHRLPTTRLLVAAPKMAAVYLHPSCCPGHDLVNVTMERHCGRHYQPQPILPPRGLFRWPC